MPRTTGNLTRWLLGAALAGGLALPGAAVAQDYPERPVTLLVAWDAGGGTDVLARMFASELEKALGQPVNVVNQTGGGGVVGHQAMVSAAPDGYTLGIATMEVTVFDSMNLADFGPADFTPIARLAEIPAGLTVSTESDYETPDDLIAAIRDQPAGSFSASGCGVGCAWQFAVAGWLISQDLPGDYIQWIPSQGGAPALQDLAAGGVDIVTASVVESRSMIEAGLVESLAVMAPERLDAFPDVPTLQETSGTDWTMSTWFGFVGPAGLPEEITAALTEAAETAYTSPEFTQFMEDAGYVPVWQPGQVFADFMTEQEAILVDLVEVLGIAQ